MNDTCSRAPSASPPLYKQALVGLLAGALLGPVVGWAAGTFTTLFAIAGSKLAPQSAWSGGGLRGSAFFGGLIGIPLGLLIGAPVGVLVRVLSSAAPGLLRSPWIGAALGALAGLAVSFAVHHFWHPSAEAFIYQVAHAAAVGASTGGVAVIARPKWL